MLAGALALVVAAGGAGWFAGSRITSPGEAAARAEAPTASLITAAVDQTVLASEIIARGDITYDDPITLSVQGSIGETGETAIVTRIGALGDTLEEGDVAIEVSGRPVILLQGEVPMYRDIRPGAKGADVKQLEEALVRLGYLATADETWTGDTGSAVQQLYADAGYTAKGTSKEDQAAIDSARDSVRFANDSVRDAEKALTEAGTASRSSVLQAQSTVKSAEEALTLAQLEREAALKTPTRERDQAQQERNWAVDNADPELPKYEAALADKADVLRIETARQDAYVASAARQLEIARAALAEVTAPVDTTQLKRAVTDAKAALADANTTLAELQAEAGTWIPGGEIIFVNYVPVQITSVDKKYGEPLGQTPFMTVSGSGIALQLSIAEDDIARVSLGQEVRIEDDSLEEPLIGEVSSISEQASSGRYRIKVTIPDVPEELIGLNVRARIPIESTGGEVLVVPAAALSAVASGDVRVEVEDPDKPGTTRFVVVETGLSADGVVQVTPRDGELKKGDRVVVGQAAGAEALDDEEASPSAEPDEG